MSNIDKIEDLQIRLKEDPSDFQARRQLAVLLLDSGFAEESLGHFIHLSKIFPTDSGLYYNMGIVYEKLKLLNRAEEVYKKAIELSPEEADSYYNLGLVYIDKKEYDMAINCFDKVLDIDTDDSNAYFNMGLAYFKKNDLIEAMDNFQKTIDMNDNDLYAHFYIGNIFKEFGDSASAASEFKKVLTISPDYSWAFYNLAVIDFENGNLIAAMENLEKTIELNSKDIEAYKIYAKILTKQTKLSEAENVLKEGIKNCGENGDLHYTLAQINKRHNLTDDYVDNMNAALRNYTTLSVSPKTVKAELSTFLAK